MFQPMTCSLIERALRSRGPGGRSPFLPCPGLSLLPRSRIGPPQTEVSGASAARLSVVNPCSVGATGWNECHFFRSIPPIPLMRRGARSGGQGGLELALRFADYAQNYLWG
jgi:hypothetical protein